MNMVQEDVKMYTLLQNEAVKELNSQAILLEHNRTKAKIFLLSNDDENKVFTIGFRTIPTDSTGVAHITEHSVLCGSKKFPLKDPFVELVKGSLNTFLNAMTYPDKTLYPVASCNDQDFHNLMDVYLDAVFNPNTYQNEKIFRQEGWHYELSDVESPLTINGVVYNEMKGVFSSPESVLDRYISTVLFPDNTYSMESGGDPKDIPDLTYEQFLEFHKKYYHPSNSYIYLYGNMDMAKTLEWLDEEYLSHYTYQEVDSSIPKQKAFTQPEDRTIPYPVSAESNSEETFLSSSVVVGDNLDPNLYIAFQILEYALLGAPGAVLKKALLDAGIGKDIYGGYENGILQPYFTIVAKGAKAEQKQQFLEVIDTTLREQVKEGLNRKTLIAGLNHFEFKYREADYGSYPRGLMYGLQSFDSWLYDASPLIHLQYEDTFAWLKEQVEKGYFEQLIADYLLDNSHQAIITLQPEKGLLEKQEQELADKLQQYKESLTLQEQEDLVQQTKDLKAFQEEADSPEVAQKIPMLTREDIGKKAAPLPLEEKEIAGVKVLHHNLFTSGIAYLRLLFDTEGLSEEELLYASLLKSVMGFVDTENYDYQNLCDEILGNTGGIVSGILEFDDCNNQDSFIGTFDVRAKALYEKLDWMLGMIAEMMLTSKFTDDKRLYEILSQLKSRAQMQMLSGGHQIAVLRASSYYSASACYSECVGGIRYYKFIEDLTEHFSELRDEIVTGLEQVAKKLFCKERLLISYTADDAGYQTLVQTLPRFIEKLPQSDAEIGKTEYFKQKVNPYHFTLDKKNEGFKTSSQVQYVARCGNFKSDGVERKFTGAMRILTVILNYDYLWINLRVKGGAYGCMSGFSRNGESYFVSYRDPNLEKTNAVYEGIPKYLRQFDADEREMTKYVIGTISDLDVPKNPMAKGARALSAWMSGLTIEQLQKERDQILACTPEDIRALADYVEAILNLQ
jgi:hypothetical protein